jgi:Ca2+-transporting ATPase
MIKSKNLVPGDIILFEPGDLIPADIRIIRSTGMKINKSTFTGES